MELQSLYEQTDGQFELLKKYLGTGPERVGALPEEAIQEGLKPEVIEAYENFAKIGADAPAELAGLFDPVAAQLTRSVAGEGIAATASLSGGWIAALVLGGLIIAGGGAYWLYQRSTNAGVETSGKPSVPATKTRCDFKTDNEFIAWCSKAIDAYQKDCDSRLDGKPGWVSCTGNLPNVFKECYQWDPAKQHPCQ